MFCVILLSTQKALTEEYASHSVPIYSNALFGSSNSWHVKHVPTLLKSSIRFVVHSRQLNFMAPLDCCLSLSDPVSLLKSNLAPWTDDYFVGHSSHRKYFRCFLLFFNISKSFQDFLFLCSTKYPKNQKFIVLVSDRSLHVSVHFSSGKMTIEILV